MKILYGIELKQYDNIVIMVIKPVDFWLCRDLPDKLYSLEAEDLEELCSFRTFSRCCASFLKGKSMKLKKKIVSFFSGKKLQDKYMYMVYIHHITYNNYQLLTILKTQE